MMVGVAVVVLVVMAFVMGVLMDFFSYVVILLVLFADQCARPCKRKKRKSA
jgi:hypothetical protein